MAFYVKRSDGYLRYWSPWSSEWTKDIDQAYEWGTEQEALDVAKLFSASVCTDADVKFEQWCAEFDIEMAIKLGVREAARKFYEETGSYLSEVRLSGALFDQLKFEVGPSCVAEVQRTGEVVFVDNVSVRQV